MRRFDPDTFDSNKNSQGKDESEGGRRDPYFEKFSYEMYQSLSENPCALFNFFIENNDIFRKIKEEDMNFMYQRLTKRQENMSYGAFGALGGMLLYDKVIKKRLFEPKIQSRFRFLTFGFKYLVFPWVVTRAVDLYMNLDDEFKKIANNYNFGYDDFNAAMNVLERAKLMGLLDELQDKRGDFDFKKLDMGLDRIK